MKYSLPFFLLLLLVSCAHEDPKQQIEQLGGYWEIVSVELPDGTEKKYSVSTTVDYMEVKGDSGIRKKVQPKLDGSFNTSKDAEVFQIKIENDSLHLYYKTPYANWKETVLSTKDSLLIVKNSDGKVFKYKKFTKFEFPN